MILEEMTMPQVEEGLTKTRTILLPFGSIEEHGNHLPLCTDQVTIYEVCRKAAKSRPVFVAPPIYFGVCRSTSEHPGTVSITTSTLKLLTKDIAYSLYTQGFRRFILVSGHVGYTHMAALTEAGEAILEQFSDTTVAVASIVDLMTCDFKKIVETPGDLHAGEFETSLIMYLKPAWVCGTSPQEAPAFPKPILARNKRKYWPGGVWGDPAKASQEKGMRMFSLLVEELVEQVRRVDSYEQQ